MATMFGEWSMSQRWTMDAMTIRSALCVARSVVEEYRAYKCRCDGCCALIGELAARPANASLSVEAKIAKLCVQPNPIALYAIWYRNRNSLEGQP